MVAIPVAMSIGSALAASLWIGGRSAFSERSHLRFWQA
jgi:hypothetical protein